jgi:hypothetical protein
VLMIGLRKASPSGLVPFRPPQMRRAIHDKWRGASRRQPCYLPSPGLRTITCDLLHRDQHYGQYFASYSSHSSKIRRNTTRRDRGLGVHAMVQLMICASLKTPPLTPASSWRFSIIQTAFAPCPEKVSLCAVSSGATMRLRCPNGTPSHSRAQREEGSDAVPTLPL